MQSLFDWIERVAHAVPEALNTWRAQSPDGFQHVAERLIAVAIVRLEADANHLDHSASENGITSSIIGYFNRYGIRADTQTNSRGHVDIYIRHEYLPTLIICGEAKIWRGSQYHLDGLAQVLGYATGRYPFCFVLSYVKQGEIQAHMRALQTALNTARPENQQEDCTAHPTIRWAWVTGHLHSSGVIVNALHAGVNLVRN